MAPNGWQQIPAEKFSPYQLNGGYQYLMEQL
jgi:hypothetical protein